jgi:carbamoyltransferase
MITLGINAAFHDSAAALVIDGECVAAAEEERFSRIKHGKRPVPFSAWELPFGAIHYCLSEAGLTLGELDHVAYSFDPRDFLGERLQGAATVTLPLEPSAHAGAPGEGGWDNPWDPLFAAYIVNAPRQLVDGAPHHLKKRFAGGSHERSPYRWHFVNHHACHQASAFLAAPFERCAVMTLDGRGERATTTYGAWRGERYEPLGAVHMPHSLGILYEKVTSHLGFLHSSDEYKVMALAAMGSPRYAGRLRERVRVGERGDFTIAPLELPAWCGPARMPGSKLEQRHFDLAASLQLVLEETVRELAVWLREASGERHLAMAGGVALNCVMNAKLRDSGVFDAVWVQPAAGDAGTALGAALWVDAREARGPLTCSARFGLQAEAAPRARRMRLESPASPPTLSPCGGEGAKTSALPRSGKTLPLPLAGEDWGREGDFEPHAASPSSGPGLQAGARTASEGNGTGASLAGSDRPALLRLKPGRWHMEHVYLGPGYADDEIEPLLRWAKLPYRRLGNTEGIAEATAELLADNRIIGWFQGRMEFGPRALGARSILASPIDPAMQQRLNELKDREDFRPVAPALPQEELANWFSPAQANGGRSPFMLFVFDTKPDQAGRIPSACHSDRTARVQTVDAATNPRFHALLQAFGRRTGVPVLVNTSFNVRGEPIVCTPRDAIEAFFSTPLDALVIGSFLVEKGGA